MPSRKIVFLAPTATQLADPGWLPAQGEAKRKSVSSKDMPTSQSVCDDDATQDAVRYGTLLRWKMQRYLSPQGSATQTHRFARGDGVAGKQDGASISLRPGASDEADDCRAKQVPCDYAQDGLRKRARSSETNAEIPGFALAPPSEESEEKSTATVTSPLSRDCSSPTPSFYSDVDKLTKSDNTSSHEEPDDIAKQKHGVMTRARPVGISRAAAPSRPPVLKSIQNQRRALAVSKAATKQVASGMEKKMQTVGAAENHAEKLAANENHERSALVGGLTTIESIPPPPPHNFALASMSNLGNILRSPEQWLSEAQGGIDARGTKLFNALVLVTRVGALDKNRDYKAGGTAMMDRCEITVRDQSGCMLRVNIEGSCATQWAGALHDESVAASHRFLDRSLSQSEQDARPSARKHHSYESSTVDSLLGLEADSTRALESFTSSMMDTSTLMAKRMLAMLPLRPGDVIVLQNLRLVRSRARRTTHARTWRTDARPTRINQPSSGIDVFAVASPNDESSLELCWRNCVTASGDMDRNFDPDLITFNARCKAIYRLAMTWQRQ